MTEFTQELMLLQMLRKKWTESNNELHQNLQDRRSSPIFNSSCEWSVGKTVTSYYTSIWYWRPYICKKLRRNEDFNRANCRCTLHEIQQYSHWHYTRAHPLWTLDHASRKRCERNIIWTLGYLYSGHSNITSYDRKNDHSVCWPPMRVEHNRYSGTRGKSTEAASLLISISMPTMIDKKIAVKLSNTKKSACSSKKKIQFVEFPVVALDQPKFIGPVDWQSSVWFWKVIPIWPTTRTNYLEQIDQNSITTPSGYHT